MRLYPEKVAMLLLLQLMSEMVGLMLREAGVKQGIWAEEMPLHPHFTDR